MGLRSVFYGETGKYYTGFMAFKNKYILIKPS